MFTRILDVAVLLLLGVAIVLPRPDVRVQPALIVSEGDRDRVAELQGRLLQAPADVDASLELADIFLDAHRPDWALATLGAAIEAHPSDHRLVSRRSLALADHFEAGAAYQSASRALALCRGGSTSAVACGEGELSRLELLVATLERVKHMDMRKTPNAAKEQILKALRPAYIPPKKTTKPTTKPVAKTPAAPKPAAATPGH